MAKFILGGLLCISLLASGAAWAVEGVTTDKIKIGFFGFLTGPGSAYGLAGRDGLLVALDEINAAGGVHGRKLEIVMEDDFSTPAGSIAAVKKLIAKDKVFALVAMGGSNPFVATLPYLIEAKIPVVGMMPSSPKMCKPFSKYIFRATCTNDQLVGYAMADFAMEHLKPKTVAICNQSDEYGKMGSSYVITRLRDKWKLKPIIQVEYDRAATDVSSQVLKLKEHNPEVTFVFAYTKLGGMTARQAHELGLKTQFVGSTAAGSYLPFLEIAGEGGVGFTSASILPVLIESDNPGMVDFLKKLEKKSPGRLSNIQGAEPYGYHGLKVFAEGLKLAGKDLTRDKFIQGLEKVKNFKTPVYYQTTFSPTMHDGVNIIKFLVILKNQKRILLDPVIGGTDLMKEVLESKD
jgi:branched-chain amino acid transport system substrate-binding protein